MTGENLTEQHRKFGLGLRSWERGSVGYWGHFLVRSEAVTTLFSPLQATDSDVGTFGEVNYFFSDDPDR